MSADFTEGQEFSVEDRGPWGQMEIQVSQVLEVYLPSTDLASSPAIYAAFYVKESVFDFKGGINCRVKFVGCGDPATSQKLSSMFNRKTGWIHVCLEFPCGIGTDCQLHVQRFKRWTVAGFAALYITPSGYRQLGRWHQETLKAMEGEGTTADVTEVGAVPTVPTPKKRAKKDKAPVDSAEKPKRRKDAGTTPPASERPAARVSALRRGGDHHGAKEGSGKDLSRVTFPELDDPRALGVEELRKDGIDPDELRRRLSKAKDRLLGTSTGPEPTAGAKSRDPVEVHAVVSSSPSRSPSPHQVHLGSGTTLRPPADPVLDTPHIKLEPKDDSRVTSKTRGKRRRTSTPKVAGSHEPRLAIMDRAREVVTKGGSIHNLQQQLVKRATEAEVTSSKRRRAKTKKEARKNPGRQLLKILTKGATRDGTSKKKSSRKRRNGQGYTPGNVYHRGGDGDDSPDSSDGASEDSSYAEDDLDKSDDTEKEDQKMEPPLRKKALRKPGSVLQLLVNHARTQLDQSSKVEMTPSLEDDATVGVRLNSYFHIVVRPTLGTALNQKRELHHLSLALDMLRQGELSGLGDLLAARFMAIHQSVVDQGWGAARHLELLPYEEGAATTPAVILQARKHAQLANKVTYGDAWTWSTSKGARGGKGRQGQWNDGEWQGDIKGKGKRNPKGKGKGKQPWKGQGNSGEAADSKTKEKPGDK